VFKSRLRVRALEDEMEKPMNVHRWRWLEVTLRMTDVLICSFYIEFISLFILFQNEENGPKQRTSMFTTDSIFML